MEPTEPNLLRATALIPRVISSFIRSERPQVTSKHVRWGVAHELGLNVRSFDGVPWKGRLKDATIAYLQVREASSFGKAEASTAVDPMAPSRPC